MMADKQQIEKFAKDLCKACSLKTCKNEYPPCVKAEWVSEALYNAGYRKVGENAVVLTQEEYYEMLADVQTVKEKLVRMFDRTKAETRKETAKEIITDIRSCMKDFEDDDGYLLKKCEFDFFMREIAKQFGVEVD